LALFGLGFDFAGYPLLDPDEGRNAEVAREMAATNDYVLPRLNGLPYLDKPVLYFAVGAAMFEVLGPSTTAARLPSLLFTLGTLTVVTWFGARLFGRPAGLVAGIATAAAPLTLAYARTTIFDSALTFFVLVAFIGFYESIRAVDRRSGSEPAEIPANPAPSRTVGTEQKGQWWCALAWAALALGVLTKGPVALALPLMVAIPYAAWRRAWRGLVDPVAVLLFAALLGPWLLAMSREIPGFLEYALVTETVIRLTTDELQRTEPFWYFLLILPAAALPWTIVVLGGWRSLRRKASFAARDPRIIFLVLWILIPLAFFTLSQSKRPQYVLPLVPAISLLVAAIWTTSSDQLHGTRPTAAFLVVFGAVLILGRDAVAGMVSATPLIAATIPATALRLGGVCIIAAAGAWLGSARRELALISLCLPVAAIPIVSQSLMDEIGHERSARDLAAAVREVTTMDTEIVGVRSFPLSLPFYLEQTITLSTSDANELTSNYLMRHLDRWRRVPGTPLRPADWWLDAFRLCDRPRIFVVRSDDAESQPVLAATLTLIIDTGRYAAYGPCGLTGLAARGPRRVHATGTHQTSSTSTARSGANLQDRRRDTVSRVRGNGTVGDQAPSGPGS
jgi:hypothetical protein